MVEVMEETRQCQQVLNNERVQALATWLKTTNTKLTQVNGQRKYGGPPEVWSGPAPSTRCEVFISQIPRDTYEDLLIPLFSSVGPLWEFRLMMNFSGQNRGFAYAKFGSSSVAADAIRRLHGYVLESGFRISVRYSTEKRNLCVGELPLSTKQEDLVKVLHMMVEGVERVSLKAGPGIKGVSAIVVFSSHHVASMAKKTLAEDFKRQFSLSVSVRWQLSAKPNPDEASPKHPQASLPKPQRLIQTAPRHSPRPASLTSDTSKPQDPSSRAVARPASAGGRLLRLPPSCPAVPSPTPVTLLQKLCELAGFGPPLYEMFCSHTGPEGFLHFTYKVSVPGVALPFTGRVMVLPGPSAGGVLEEARQAAGQQVLQSVYSSQLGHQ